MRTIAVCLGVLVAALTQAQALFGDEKQAFILMPAEAITSGIVDQVQISDTGRYVFYRQAPIKDFDQLLTGSYQANLAWNLYDRTTKKAQKISIPIESTDVIFLSDGHSIFFLGRTATDPQGFLDLTTGRISQTQLPTESISYFGDRAGSPFLMVQQDNQPAQIIRPDGRTMSIKLKPKMRLASPLGSDARNLYFSGYVAGQPTQYGRISVSLADGSLDFKSQTIDEWRKDFLQETDLGKFASESNGDVTYVRLTEEIKDSKSEIPKRAQLGLSDCRPSFSRDGSFVVYQDAGALLLREIKPVDPSLAKKALDAAAKARAISNAKQSALALLMYASDMDDVLPGAEGWEDKVMPYCLNRDMLKSFNYTFKGGDINSVDSPATTELGFVMGPGGRAVAYADGHVKWIPNP